MPVYFHLPFTDSNSNLKEEHLHQRGNDSYNSHQQQTDFDGSLLGNSLNKQQAVASINNNLSVNSDDQSEYVVDER